MKALKLALFAVVLLGPLLSFKLDGFTIHFDFMASLWLFLLVFLGKLAFDFCSPYFRFTLPVLTPPSYLKNPKWQILLLATVCFTLPFLISKYWLSVLILAFIYILLGLGLHIVVGLAGLLNLGFAAFFAVGAYTFAILAQFWGVGFWSAIPIALFLGAFFGALLAFPVLRMQGDYLAIVTLGFGEIIRLLLENGGKVTGGPNGLTVPAPTLFGIEFGPYPREGGMTFHSLLNVPYDSLYRYLFIYFILLAFVSYLLFFILRLQKLPLGRAFEALREDEIACRALGINHVTTKLYAFSLSAMIGSLAGVCFAGFAKFVNPASFTFAESALILVIVVLGGMGSLAGVIIAALVLTLLPEMLREFATFRMLIFGIILILMMIWRPQGLFQSKRPIFAKPSRAEDEK